MHAGDRRAGACQHFGDGGALGGPDLGGVMFDPARLGEVLPEFALRSGDRCPLVVKEDGP